MPQTINVNLMGDQAWPELEGTDAVELPTEHLEVAFLDNGTEGGNPVVLVRVDKDGQPFIFQITGKSFQAIAAALHGKYGVIE